MKHLALLFEGENNGKTSFFPTNHVRRMHFTLRFSPAIGPVAMWLQYILQRYIDKERKPADDVHRHLESTATFPVDTRILKTQTQISVVAKERF